MLPCIVLDGDRDARDVFRSLATDEVLVAVTSAIERHGRDVIAIVDAGQLVIVDRARTETDPELPAALRWLRSARRGSWLVLYRDDGVSVRARLQIAPVTLGGSA